MINGLEENRYRLRKVFSGLPITLFQFDITPKKLSDFNESHYYRYGESGWAQSNERSRLVTIPTLSGRVTLSNEKIKITNHEGQTETILANSDEFKNALINHFGMQANVLDPLIARASSQNIQIAPETKA